MFGRTLEHAYFGCEAVQGGHGLRALAPFDRRSRGNETVDHTDERPIELRGEQGEQLFPHVQTKSRLSPRKIGRGCLAARQLSGPLKPNSDLDDEDRLGQKGQQREDVVAKDAEAGGRQEQNVSADRRDHGGKKTGAAAAVPRRDDHRGWQK